jgi:hypothetical protein
MEAAGRDGPGLLLAGPPAQATSSPHSPGDRNRGRRHLHRDDPPAGKGAAEVPTAGSSGRKYKKFCFGRSPAQVAGPA